MPETLHLQWRGKPLGPYTLEQVRTALQDGEIHSLYQIQVQGGWTCLRDYLEALDSIELERRAAEIGSRAREDATASQPTAMAQSNRYQGVLQKPNPFANPPPVYVKQTSSGYAASSSMASVESGASDDGTLAYQTCWLAVVAFVVSCGCFVPYLNLVCWVPSLVLGILALKQIQRSPSLEGRGLAITAICIALSLLLLAIFTAWLSPDWFHHLFPL